MSERYMDFAKEIIGICENVLLKENTASEKSELEKKVANKIDLIVCEECLDCEYYLEHEKDHEPPFMMEELD